MTDLTLPEWPSSIEADIRGLYASLTPPSQWHRQNHSWLAICPNHIEGARKALFDLRQLIESHDFESEAEEIQFFKLIKPRFSAHLIFWSKLFQFYLDLPIGGRKIRYKYWSRISKNLHRAFLENKSFYRYYRSSDNSMDRQFFLRRPTIINPGELISEDLNALFATAKDRAVGELLAMMMLEEFISSEEGNDSLFPNPQSTTPKSALSWTASKASLVELIYALHCVGVYNHGKAEIKEIADTFQELFHVELGNYYGVFNEIRLRKKNRTSLLDLLKEKVIQKMDLLDD